jgi:Zn/Cd-binding protein ZinT
MPTLNYESINTNTDVTTTRTLLHESIPLTGAIVSGTYGQETSEENIKNYTHGMFQSVYDYPYLSSSANHIFDITMGYHSSSPFSSSASEQNAKKINLYTEFAQVLLGYTGSDNIVEIFESDLDFGDNNNQMKSCYFVNFSRLLTKDQVKKGSFSMTIGTGSWLGPFDLQAVAANGSTSGSAIVITDASSSEVGGTNTKGNGGEYAVLYRRYGTEAAGYTYSGIGAANENGVGVIFYQAGIVVLTSSIWDRMGPTIKAIGQGTFYRRHEGHLKQSISGAFTGSSISGACDALRHRIANISFNNTTEINSTIYFCRAAHNKFNYSSNPTYISGSKIRVKNVSSDSPISYITTIGLYNASNELLAVAKLSEPIKKDPTTELTLRVRLDY